ncbi:MAG: hypothetical protein JST64_14750, partial [Actinobacteria bacterium]|nr:hypothetical protein [Actinomycetota bacterium]
QSAADAGRDAASIVVSSGTAGVFGDDPIGAVEELAAKGVDRCIVPAFAFMQDTEATIADFGERVIAAANGR